MNTSEDNNREYTNGEITVYWQPKLCIHAGECFTRLPRVFKPRAKPWVDLSQANTQEIIKTVNACPTDALTYKWNDSNEEPKKKEVLNNDEYVEITVNNKGSIRIRGKYILKDENNNELAKGESCTLCGCGKTKKAPFCDGSHYN